MQAIAYCNKVARIIKADNIDRNKRIEELERIRHLFTTRDRGIIFKLSEFIDCRISEAAQKPLTCVLPELIEYVYTSHCSAWLLSKHQINNVHVRVPIYLKSFPPNAMDQMLKSFVGNDVGSCLLCDVAAIITLMFAWNISEEDFANQQCPLLFELSNAAVGCSGNTTFNAKEIISTFRSKARPYAFKGTELEPSDEVVRIFGEYVTDLSPEHHDANTTDSEDIPEPQNIVTRSANNDLSPSVVIKIPLLKTLDELEGRPSVVIKIPLLKTWDELESAPNLSQTQPEQVEKTNGGTITPKPLTSVEPSSSHVVSTRRPNSQAAQRNLLKRLDNVKIDKQRFTEIMQQANELFAKIKANDNDANNRSKLVKCINYYMHPVVFEADSSIDMLEYGITLLKKDGERLDAKIANLESQLSKM